MKNLTTVSLLALMAVACCGDGAMAQQTPSQTNTTVAPSQTLLANRIRALLQRNAQGGNALTVAIQNLLERDPRAISDVISVAKFNANPEQALALEQGVIQAEAQLKTSNPTGAQTIQSYLDSNKANTVVAQILSAQGAEGAVNQFGNGQNGNGQGTGGNGQGGGGGGGASQGGNGGAQISFH